LGYHFEFSDGFGGLFSCMDEDRGFVGFASTIFVEAKVRAITLFYPLNRSRTPRYTIRDIKATRILRIPISAFTSTSTLD
jgi:hypothetical protein